jgi:H+/Cl- antiporter ClcA
MAVELFGLHVTSPPHGDFRTNTLSGASIGPEAPLGSLAQEIAAFFFQKLKLARQTWTGFQGAALASMYNAVIGSPLFCGVLVTEFSVGGKSALMYLGWNLLAGVIGYLVFTLLGLLRERLSDVGRSAVS